MQAFDRFVEIIARLRAPDGCPWDREQTHETLIPYCIEEAYEVVDAIREGNLNELKGELGDLILQVVLHAQVAKDNKDFTIEDVLNEISDKMVRRHPHVFSDAKVETAGDVVKQWDELKKKEGKKSVLQGIPKHAPQLHRSLKIGEKVAAVGFDWKKSSDVLDKVNEELLEIEAAKNSIEKEEEFGDLLFSIVQWARYHKIDPEQALLKANAKFEKRFVKMEEKIEADQKVFKKLSLDELEAYWQQIKKE
ncbi:MAG: nucleoside triphosphate pyrophosphohydrolase [Proteobacteria bacterium]|jgi:tetrapyrrole methylase family protein/MazG family protein|nr:nucleoside triphosphate pyrophosphohydrolase [Pseudomonadota bacterium]